MAGAVKNSHSSRKSFLLNQRFKNSYEPTVGSLPFLPEIKIIIRQKSDDNFSLAGAVGIEPTLRALETPVLPLYDAPMSKST